MFNKLTISISITHVFNENFPFVLLFQVINAVLGIVFIQATKREEEVLYRRQ